LRQQDSRIERHHLIPIGLSFCHVQQLVLVGFLVGELPNFAVALAELLVFFVVEVKEN